jgi:hypothetical protein
VQVQGSEGKRQSDNKGFSSLEVCEARLIAVIVISSEGSFSQEGAPINNKISQNWFSFPQGFFPGVLLEISVCKCVWFLLLLLSLIFVKNLAVL